MVDDDRLLLLHNEVPRMLSVRFRTLGCYPLTGAVRSTANTLDAIIDEMRTSVSSERQRRLIDHDESGSMEKKRNVTVTSNARPGSKLAGRKPAAGNDPDAARTAVLTCGSVDDGKSTLTNS
jgi:hypothetical protein